MRPAELVDFLAGPRAMELRRSHARPPGEPPADPLTVARALRRELDAARARALAEQVELERRAWAKFEDPRALLFERVALEQCTPPAIARHHASLFPHGAEIADLGCGLGADSAAFARRGLRVLAVERDPLRARLARHNLSAVGLRVAVALADAAAPPTRARFAFADPDRRAQGRRRPSLAGASPSLDVLLSLRRRLEGLAVKASAAIPDEEIPADAACDFLSEGGTCKEALLTWGLGLAPGSRRAVLAATGEMRAVEPAPPAPVAETGAYLLDPDPALVRASGVDARAAEVGAARVDPRVDYLFADRLAPSPWVRGYRVLAIVSARRRDLLRVLSDPIPGTIVVKSRGFDPEETKWRRVLPCRAGGPARVLVFFARGRTRRAAICAPAAEELSS